MTAIDTREPVPALTPDSALEGRANHVGRTQGAGLFARRQALRLSREELVHRARMLPAVPQALLVAHYDLGMGLDELAALQKMPRQKLYRRLVHWRDVLSDRSFLLAVHFAHLLPPRRAALARDYWMTGLTLRQLAHSRHVTVHEVRTRLAEARAELIAAAARMRRELDDPDT